MRFNCASRLTVPLSLTHTLSSSFSHTKSLSLTRTQTHSIYLSRNSGYFLSQSLHISLPLAVCAVIGLRCPVQLLYTTNISPSALSNRGENAGAVSDGKEAVPGEGEEILESNSDHVRSSV